MKKIVALWIIVFVLVSCTKERAKPYTFYYWRTHLRLDAEEKKALDRAENSYLYTRFFDIGKKDGQFETIGLITKDESFETDKEIVPVIFIKNESFYNITAEEINFLVQKINTLIQKKQKEFHFKTSKEIQIDCDWTLKTKNDYFKFLKQLKAVSGKNITCTLRLHQAKDKAQTGIPPVEKVYLMAYATSSPLENSEKNSILNINILKSYLKNINRYPLKFDVALPIYSWGIVTNHLGKHKLINALTEEDLQAKKFRKIKNCTYEVPEDGFYFGMYLNKGFTIKIETTEEEDILEVQKFVNEKTNKSHNFIYYHLDHQFIKRYKKIFQ